jgi:taurine transport system permease protein
VAETKSRSTVRQRSGSSRRATIRLRYTAVSLVSACAFIGLWEALAAVDVIEAEFFPPPSHVWGELAKLVGDGTLLDYALVSARRVLIGFMFSATVGTALGILLGTMRPLRWLVQPVISIIRPLPSLAWIPLSLLWLGIGEEQKYAIVFMGTLAPLVVFVTDATLRVDPLYVRAARNLGASHLAIMLEIILPAALPSIISALKVTLALAWTCIISAEMVGSKDGLGYLIWNAKDWSNVAQVICGMLAISVTVLALDTVLRSIEHRLVPWQRGQRLATGLM